MFWFIFLDLIIKLEREIYIHIIKNECMLFSVHEQLTLFSTSRRQPWIFYRCTCASLLNSQWSFWSEICFLYRPMVHVIWSHFWVHCRGQSAAYFWWLYPWITKKQNWFQQHQTFKLREKIWQCIVTLEHSE